MKRNKIVTRFDGMSDANFRDNVAGIYAAMFENENFLNVVPALTEVNAKMIAFGEALAAAKDRDRNSVAMKNLCRQILTDAFVQLASSVSTIANGNKEMLISSGFSLAKSGEFIPLEMPNSIKLSDGVNTGELIIKIPVVAGARCYGAGYTSDPLTADSEWTQRMTTSTKFTFRHLVPNQKYWCRMAAFGPYGQVVYSNPVCRVVQ